MEFTIRPVNAGDGEGINILRRLPGTFENILGIPSERIKRNEEFVQNMGSDTHAFVAVAKHKNNEEIIIGMATMQMGANPRLRHTAGCGIMVHVDYQNKGVGTALMKALIDIADNWLMIARIELTVFSDNVAAIHLYEKLGFEREGLKKYAAIRYGKYEDELLMARINYSLIPGIK
jgi:putative acetyltransferase